MIEITAALGGLRAAMDIAKGALAARDDAKLQAAMTDMAARLFDAYESGIASAEKVVTLQSALHAAEREMRDVKAEFSDRMQYALHEVRPGALVYAFKPAADSVEPAHYLCQICRDKGIKSILTASLDGAVLICKEVEAHGVVMFSRNFNVPLGR